MNTMKQLRDRQRDEVANLVKQALHKTGYNQSAAARMLGMGIGNFNRTYMLHHECNRMPKCWKDAAGLTAYAR